jgi:hypothetical protein
MKPWLAITRLLSILAVLGLVLAPFTVPAVAGGMAAPMTMADAGAMDMASMGDDMPCCPPEKPVMPDCQKACPLATLCIAKIVQGIAPASAVPSRFSIARALLPGNDANLKTLDPIPPPRPPQA